MREIRSTPSQPIFYSQIHFGVFRDPFPTVNLVDADIYGHRWAPRWWRNLRLKEWEHFGIVHDEFYCGVAVFDAKFLAVSFCYVYDRRTRRLVEHKRTTLRRGAIHAPEQLWRGDGFFRQPGYRIDLQNRLQKNTHFVQVDIQADRHLPPVKATFTVREDLTALQPLIAVLPVNDCRRPMYTHKAACPVEGRLQVGEREWTLATRQGWALIDVQKTFYPRDSFWKWATFAGCDQDGAPLAINLTHNMIKNDEEWNECCLWVDGRLNLLGAARFEFNRQDIQQPWHIVTTDGRVNLTFTPEGERSERINAAGLLCSDFHQPFGTYSGTVVDSAGKTRIVDGVFGIAEHHLMRA
jgi:hypothetical protein